MTPVLAFLRAKCLIQTRPIHPVSAKQVEMLPPAQQSPRGNFRTVRQLRPDLFQIREFICYEVSGIKHISIRLAALTPDENSVV